MTSWRGEWALVTGASSGIGRAIAVALAADGVKIVLTARRTERLNELAKTLSTTVEIFEADLAQVDAPRRIFEFTESKGIRPALLVNNAGFGTFGPFRSIDLTRQLAMVQVNCAAVLALTGLYLPQMVERRQGDILIVGSTAAFQAVPYQSAYAATKAFDLIFAEGLAEEVKRYGIRVCALCPGQTKSEFHEVAQEPIPKAMSVQSAEEVARIGLDALLAGKHSVICGFANRMGMELQRIVSRRVAAAVAERLFRPEDVS
jgi:short-subunit dehydrogenase